MTDDTLPLLLDADRVRTRLERIPALAARKARLGSVVLERLWIKPGRHLHGAYRVELTTERGPQTTRAAVGALRDAPPHAVVLRRAIQNGDPTDAVAFSAADSTALIDDPPVLAQLFPWDFRLPTLPIAVNPARAGTALGEPVLEVEPVGYWPGMRCQLRYRLAVTGTCFGKVFPDDSGAAVGETMRRISDAAERASGLRTPRVARYAAALQCLITEPVAGVALYEQLGTPDLQARVERVAGALAAFHELAVDGIERLFGPQDDLAVVGPWVSLVSRTFPELAADLGDAHRELEREEAPTAGAAICLIHRDFYDKQVLLDGPAVAVLDLDTACRGHAEIDVGNFLAHLTLRGLQGQLPRTAADAAAHVFLDAYRARRPAIRAALVRWYRRAALLRLACVYAVRPTWRHLAPSLAKESRHGGD